MSTTPISILCGVDDIIDEWVSFSQPEGKRPYYHHKKNYQRWAARGPQELDGLRLTQAIYQRIATNWDPSSIRKSKENWRWRPCLKVSAHNKSAEVPLERAVVGLKLAEWTNHVPTASGLCGSNPGKHRCVDLVRRTGDLHYEFIELKVGANNPLYAAMEILQYGMLYLFTRTHLAELCYNPNTLPELLQAIVVHLRVLAPTNYYKYYLWWFEDVLNKGISKYAARHNIGVSMSFRFDRFPDWFQLQSPPVVLAKALQGIAPAFTP